MKVKEHEDKAKDSNNFDEEKLIALECSTMKER